MIPEVQWPVTARFPMFYEPMQELLDDPEMTAGSAAFNDLMNQSGTFQPF
jgi:hypothetical protein